MKTEILSFLAGASSALLVTFIAHFLSVRRYKSATIYGEKIKIYSLLIPILQSPCELSLSTEEVCSIFNRSILVSSKVVSKELDVFLSNIKALRLKEYSKILNKKTTIKRPNKSKWNKSTSSQADNLAKLMQQAVIRGEKEETLSAITPSNETINFQLVSEYLAKEGERVIEIIKKEINK